MPSSVVHVGFALVLAAALLGTAYSRKALGVIVIAVVVAEFDAIVGWVVPGAHRAFLHNLLLPAIACGVLYWDTRWRGVSWLRERYGSWGVRVAWVAVFAHVWAHALLDFAHLDGVNLFYPVVDQFYRLDGQAYVSSREGFVQTFIGVSRDPATGALVIDAGARGTTAEVHVPTPVDPDSDLGPFAPVERVIPIAVHGWQLYLVLVGVFVVVARRFQSDSPAAEQDG